MARRKSRKKESEVKDYRHDATRKNIPPAGLAAQGKVEDVPETRYSYDPHLPPVLRFDETGESDLLPELIEQAKQRLLSDEEAQTLTPIDPAAWEDLPEQARPSNPIVFLDDSVVSEIHAERIPADGNSMHYEVELDWRE